MSTHKERIRRRIRECKKEIEKYSKYEYELKYALDYCEQAQSGVSLLMNGQYEKVKSNCTEAIGEEIDLLTALHVKHKNMPEICTSIGECLKKGISGIQQKIEELREELKRLYEKL